MLQIVEDINYNWQTFMSRVVQINITETAETLLKLLKQTKQVEAKEKIQALYLLKTSSVETVQYLATLYSSLPNGS